MKLQSYEKKTDSFLLAVKRGEICDLLTFLQGTKEHFHNLDLQYDKMDVCAPEELNPQIEYVNSVLEFLQNEKKEQTITMPRNVARSILLVLADVNMRPQKKVDVKKLLLTDKTYPTLTALREIYRNWAAETNNLDAFGHKAVTRAQASAREDEIDDWKEELQRIYKKNVKKIEEAEKVENNEEVQKLKKVLREITEVSMLGFTQGSKTIIGQEALQRAREWRKNLNKKYKRLVEEKKSTKKSQ